VPVEPVAPPVTTAVVVALGENNVAVPCLMFATVLEAREFLEYRYGPADYFGQYGPVTPGDMHYSSSDYFTTYHNGCGDIEAFEVREVKFGKPITHFDLG
jgi:hypothetical protein